MKAASRYRRSRTKCVLLLGAWLLVAGAAPVKDQIQLPEILAVELPKPLMMAIAPDESPMKELLESANAGSLAVTHDRLQPLSIGGNLVTWTAWEGMPQKSPARSTRSAYVYVFPYGQTPIGVSGNDHATAGNHAAKVVRDATGTVHAAWLDDGRSGAGSRIMYRRGTQDPVSGIVKWESEPIRISDARSEGRSAYLGMAASENVIHFTWNYNGRPLYRRLAHKAGAWELEAIRGPRMTGEFYENGPDIGVRGDDEVHILTPSGQYAVSTDGGLKWKLDHLPLPRGTRLKNPALAVDRAGNAHFAFTLVQRGPEKNWSYNKPNHGYTELRYVRRTREGAWVDAQNVLENFPRWAKPTNDWDVISDWADIAADPRGNIHLAWHGTVNTHIFGNDEAFYSRRDLTRENQWGAWSAPQSLHPVNAAAHEYFSFAPSISVDDGGELALAVVFFDRTRGDHVLDVDARLLKNGLLEGAPIVLSRMADLPEIDGKFRGVSSWFAVAGQRIFRQPNGRVWLDALSTAVTPAGQNSPFYIIYHWAEITQRVKPAEH